MTAGPSSGAGGGGTPAFPDDVRVALTLLDLRRFGSGFTHLHYST